MIQDVDIVDLKKIITLAHSKSGYDFKDYAMSSFKRRIIRIMELRGLNVDTLLKKMDKEPMYIQEFLDNITVNTTEFFRDPGFWRLLRKDIITGIYAVNKNFRILHAGCSSGEEVMSMVILLREMGISDTVKLFATDIDTVILERAMSGTYSLKSMELNEKNYLRFEGKAALQDYYDVHNDKAVFHSDLLKNVSFRKHDLVSGEVLNKFDLILCRNVMIYFNQNLQSRVIEKFHSSLFKNGYLAIGTKESISYSEVANRFKIVDQEEKIYQKIRE